MRSKPVVILADGATIKTTHPGQTVGGGAGARGHFAGGSRTIASRRQRRPLSDRLHDPGVRVVEEWFVEAESMPLRDASAEPDRELEIDYQRIGQRGHDGVRKRRYCVTFENGLEIKRVLERDWIAEEPQPRILVYGTKIVLRDLATARASTLLAAAAGLGYLLLPLDGRYPP